MHPVAYDHFYGYDELTDTLRAWADEAPQLCSLESSGTSFEGRDIWLVTVTNSETGKHQDKPAFSGNSRRERGADTKPAFGKKPKKKFRG